MEYDTHAAIFRF